MRKQTYLICFAAVFAGCQSNNPAAVETTPKPNAPAYRTAGLDYLGFPFKKPIRYKAVGLPQGTAEGERTIKTAVEDGKLMVTATWSAGLAALDSETDVADADGVHLHVREDEEHRIPETTAHDRHARRPDLLAVVRHEDGSDERA